MAPETPTASVFDDLSYVDFDQYAEQVLLMAYYNKLFPADRPPEANTEDTGGLSPYLKILNAPEGQITNIVNKLSVQPDLAKYIHETAFSYDQLVPEIHIYKVLLGGENKVSEILFPFKNNTDFGEFGQPHGEGPFAGKTSYMGPDAGIKSFTYKMEGRGRNPFSAHIISAELSLFFQDVKTLFKPLTLPTAMETPVGKFSYSDLIRHSPGADATTAFRIRAKLGWSASPILEETSPGLSKMAEGIKTTLILDLRSHDMKFAENGSVELIVRYTGIVENMFNSPKSDILSLHSWGADVEGTLQQRQLAQATIAGFATSERQELQALQTRKSVLSAANLSLDGILQGQQGGTTARFLQDEAQRLTEATVTILETRPDDDYTNAVLSGETDSRGLPRWHGMQATDLRTRLEDIEDDESTYRGLEGTRTLTAIEGLLDVPVGSEREAIQLIAQKRTELAILNMQMDDIQSNYREKVNAELANIEDAERALARQRQAGRAKNTLNFTEEIAKKSGIYTIEKNPQLIADFIKFLNQRKTNQLDADLQERLRAQTFALDEAPPDESSPFAGLFNTLRQSLERRIGELQGGEVSVSDIKTAIFRSRASRTAADSTYLAGDKIMFFFLGDLVNALLLKEDSEGEALGTKLEAGMPNFRLIFGPMAFDDPLLPPNSNQLITNLYRIPISVKLFVSFMTMKVVGENKRTYRILQFLEDLIKFIMDKVVASRLEAYPASNRNNIKVDLVPIVLNKNFVPTDSVYANFTEETMPHTTGVTPIRNMSPAFFVQAIREHVKNSKPAYLNGKSGEDENKGIFHFLVGGPDKGLLKSIEFSEARSGLLETALWRESQSGGEGIKSGIITPAKFGVKLKLVGAPFFRIGQLFFVNTRLVDGGYFMKENLSYGGYYIITMVDHHYGPAGYTTELEGILEVPDRLVVGPAIREALGIQDVTTVDTLSAAEVATGVTGALVELENHRSSAELAAGVQFNPEGVVPASQDTDELPENWQTLQRCGNPADPDYEPGPDCPPPENT